MNGGFGGNRQNLKKNKIMEIKKGSVLKEKRDGYYRKALGLVDSVYILSGPWDDGDTEERKNEQQCYGSCFYTKPYIEKRYELVEVEWDPNELLDGDKYWYLNDLGVVKESVWSNLSSDHFRLRFRNIYQTYDTAQAALQKIMTI